MKITLVAAGRRSLLKINPIVKAIERQNERNTYPHMETVIVHSDHHDNPGMPSSILGDADRPSSMIQLDIGSGTEAEQTSRAMIAFEEVFADVLPDLVLVAGEVNATMACTIAAKKLNIAVGHIDAGLRSLDMMKREEINRKVTDFIADYLFTSDPYASANLKEEGIPSNRIFFVGNVMIESLLDQREEASDSKILQKIGLRNGKYTLPYGVLALQPRSNMNTDKIFHAVGQILGKISDFFPVILSGHPETREEFQGHVPAWLSARFPGEGLLAVPAMAYPDYLWLISNAEVVLTDSADVQEETTILGVPCLTLRDDTERPITMVQGTNRLVGTRKDDILEGFHWVMDQDIRNRRPEKWDGSSAERVVHVLGDLGQGRSAWSNPNQVSPVSGFEVITLEEVYEIH